MEPSPVAAGRRGPSPDRLAQAASKADRTPNTSYWRSFYNPRPTRTGKEGT